MQCIVIGEHLLDQIKRRAVETKRTVSQVIEDDVRVAEIKRQQEDATPRPRFTLPTFHLAGIRIAG